MSLSVDGIEKSSAYDIMFMLAGVRECHACSPGLHVKECGGQN